MGDTCDVAVVGLGYVGLSTALCLASRRIRVVGVDIDSTRVDAINKNELPIHEPSLDVVLKDALEKGFMAKTEIPSSKIYFITVGTPSKKDGSVDLSYVLAASDEIGAAIKTSGTIDYPLIVTKSTVPPGTTRNLVKERVERSTKLKAGVEIGFCSNPEFLREGSAVEDTFNPDRIIIGEYDKRSGDILEELYRRFHGPDKMPPLMKMTIENSELTKYANNAFLAMKVSFINEIANLCQKTPGADVTDVAKGIGLDKRIGERFLNAGLGWGGSCFPKDIKAIIAYSKNIGCRPLMLGSTLEVNDGQPYVAIDLAKAALGRLKGRRVALLGLAFKPNTDDVRGAVSLKIIRKLLDEGAKVVAYDPAAARNVELIFGAEVSYSRSVSECLSGAECCIIVTEWDEFAKLAPKDFIERMESPIVIDGRRIFKPADFLGRQVKFAAIGLGEEADRTLH
jgi:UDPglucose 6-dehydrogenase